MPIKRALRALFRTLDYEVTATPVYRRDAYSDVKRVIGDGSVLFDIGANRGQSIDVMRRTFPRAAIHAFEPGAAFDALTKTHSVPGVFLNNLALGSVGGRHTFFDNDITEMSSMLELGPDGWGRVHAQRSVPVSTVDAYCFERGIQAIDLLKSRTQGFNLEVLKGAERMLPSTRLILIEIIFAKLYERQAAPHEIFQFLIERGFDLVSLYKLNYHKGLAGWTDGLFVRRGQPTSIPL